MRLSYVRVQQVFPDDENFAGVQVYGSDCLRVSSVAMESAGLRAIRQPCAVVPLLCCMIICGCCGVSCRRRCNCVSRTLATSR
jgi:hypothetical protein